MAAKDKRIESQGREKMARMIFVNLPVQDLERSKAFYEAIGFRNEPKFSNEAAAMMVLSALVAAKFCW